MEGRPRNAGGTTARWAITCAECDAALAYDQRYCVECGARRGPLPATIAALIGAPLDAGQAQARAVPLAPEPAEEPAASVSWLPGGLPAPAPSIAAVAVIALLAFGVFLGSAVRPGDQSGAAAPLLVAVSRPAASAPAPSARGSSGSAGSASSVASTPTPPSPSASSPASPTPTPTPGTPASTAPPTGTSGPSGSSAASVPPVKHVFLIALADNGYDAAFGSASAAPYLATTLRSQGELLANYYAVTHGGLANAIALISGQGPNPQTAADCPTYTDVTPGAADPTGQITGAGCVYPSRALILADQLTAKGKSWKAYVQSIGNGGSGQPATCRHPALGTADPAQAPRPGDAYVTWRNPFVYFHNLVDAARACARNDVGLEQLAPDLKSASTAPSFAYIVPDRCHDGSQSACGPGQSTGLASADSFLRTVVPQIEGSAAYKDGGLIAITFDQAPPGADSSACCNTPQYPNLPGPAGGATGASGSTGPGSSLTGGQVSPTGGGGRVGLLLISPYVKAGTTNDTDYYDHFSLLRSIEDLFGLGHLGYAQDPALPAFDSTVYTAYSGGG